MVLKHSYIFNCKFFNLFEKRTWYLEPYSDVYHVEKCFEHIHKEKKNLQSKKKNWIFKPLHRLGMATLLHVSVYYRMFNLLTAPKRLFPWTRSTNCSAISIATRLWASTVFAPRWGVQMTFGCWTKEKSFRGSCHRDYRSVTVLTVRGNMHGKKNIITPKANRIKILKTLPSNNKISARKLRKEL